MHTGESTTLGAAQRILPVLCESLRWEHGEFWNLDRPADVLRCVQTWHAPRLTLHRRRLPLAAPSPAAQACLVKPDRGELAWEHRPAEDASLRASVAAKVGPRGGCLSDPPGEEVLGVLGFTVEIRQPDEEVLQMMSTIGSQIGQFIERKRAEEERERQSLRQVSYFRTWRLCERLNCPCLAVGTYAARLLAQPLVVRVS